MFYGLVLLFLLIYRKKFELQGIIALLKTKVGLRFMDNIARKYPELVRILGLVGIGVGYLGMLLAYILVFYSLYLTIKKPIVMDGSPFIIPGVKIAGTGIIFPLVIGWISLFVIMIVHEFSHGIVARLYKVKILSSGILFMGPILGAFVEPDEKQMAKKQDYEQYSILAAGPFSNIILSAIIILLSVLLVIPAYNVLSNSQGAVIQPQINGSAYPAGIHNKSVITGVNNITTHNVSSLILALKSVKPNESLSLNCSGNIYRVVTGKNPNNKSRGYLGILILGNDIKPRFSSLIGRVSYYSIDWIKELFFWIWFISLNIGIINLYPIYITDGARMLRITLERIFNDKKRANKIWGIINKISLYLLLALLLIPFLRLFY